MSYNCERKPEYQRKTHTAKENPHRKIKPIQEGWTVIRAKQQHTGLLPLKTKTILCTSSTYSFLCYDAGHLSMIVFGDVFGFWSQPKRTILYM